MNKINVFLVCTCFIFSSSVFATTAATVPTKSSKPLPTIETVHNIDTVISENVQAKIEKSVILKGQAVSAVSIRQMVTLEGTVETKKQEEEAIRIAKSIKGVKEVKSQLTIKGFKNQ